MFRMLWLKNKWKELQAWAHCHKIACKRVHHGTHLCYFFLVGMHGPYHYAALALLVVGLALLIVDIE